VRRPLHSTYLHTPLMCIVPWQSGAYALKRSALYMLPILCQISLPWQRGLIARPQQPPTTCKDLDDIFYWVIVYFISNFVSMATRVGRGGICLTAFNSHTPKTPCCVQESRRYLPQKRVIDYFVLNFRCHGNRGWSW